jgi:hypothetical protein
MNENHLSIASKIEVYYYEKIKKPLNNGDFLNAGLNTFSLIDNLLNPNKIILDTYKGGSELIVTSKELEKRFRNKDKSDYFINSFEMSLAQLKLSMGSGNTF